MQNSTSRKRSRAAKRGGLATSRTACAAPADMAEAPGEGGSCGGETACQPPTFNALNVLCDAEAAEGMATGADHRVLQSAKAQIVEAV